MCVLTDIGTRYRTFTSNQHHSVGIVTPRVCSLTQRSGPTIRRFVHKTARSNIDNDPSHKRYDDCHCDHHHNFLHVHFLHNTTLEHDNIENCNLDYLHRRVSPGLLC